ncbi:unnamed protein product [Caenorhabditis nigoni]
MTSLPNIYNKNATLKNGGILAFIATASAENQQLEDPQDSIPYLEMVVIVSIILAICYIIYAVCALWTLRQYLRAHVVHSQQWKTFVEFPVIHHACHVIRKFYSVSLVVNMCFCGVLCYVIIGSGLDSLIWILFGHVYQILIAFEIFNGLENKDEQLMGPELEARQMEKKKRIRRLYKIFLIRDFVLMPVLLIYDSYEIFTDVQSGKSVLLFGTGVFMVAYVLTSTSICLAVPLSMACYLVNKIINSKIRKNQNPLQRIIFCQGVLISITVMTALVINFTIKLFNFTSFSQGPFKVFSIAYIPSILQLPEVFLTLCIMSMTLVGCKKKEQVSTSANLCKVGPLPVAGDIENPPIQNSY